jgi:hypothetical protein
MSVISAQSEYTELIGHWQTSIWDEDLSKMCKHCAIAPNYQQNQPLRPAAIDVRCVGQI